MVFVKMSNHYHSSFWLHTLFCVLGLFVAQVLSVPFFGPFRQTTTVRPKTTTTSSVPVIPHPYPYQQLRGQRIINADHGSFIGLPPQPSSHYAGGNNGNSHSPRPWISGTKDQFIQNQLVILHPDSPLNREAWKESGYLNPDFDPTPRKSNNASSTPKPSILRSPSPLSSSYSRARKLHRRPKQHQNEQTQTYVPKPTATVSNEPVQQGPSPDESSQNTITQQHQPQQQNFVSGNMGGGGFYDIPQPIYFRDSNPEIQIDDGTGTPIIASGEPILFNGNNLLIPITAPMYPYHHQPRGAIPSQHSLPPEAMIQFLKSPEQELSPLTRPQVKLPFPLSRDCSASGGGSGSNKPLQFVVLPIVEPVAPLKPIFPKPSFLSQYGQFPYIPPFNLFKKPPVPPSQDSSGNVGGSGQFVPILNRPAPPLPFVFVQSLPMELIGQNQEMDVIHSSASSTSTTSENKVKEASEPVAAPQPSPTPTPTPQSESQPVAAPAPTQQPAENIPPVPTRPLPLIVIEKKTPGQPPSSSVASAAAVVEISKQSIQKSSGGAPHTTISVVQPITAPGSKPPTLQQQHDIQKAIEKLVPVAAAVLENVEQEELKQKEQGRDRDISGNVETEAETKVPETPTAASSEAKVQQVPNVGVPVAVPLNEQEKTPLRRPLRPENIQETVLGGIPPINSNSQHKRPDISSSEEIGTGASTLSEVEVMEA